MNPSLWWAVDACDPVDQLQAAAFVEHLSRTGVDALLLDDTTPDGVSGRPDPVLLASWLLPDIPELLLVVTLRVSDAAPYAAARRIIALDQLAQGRIAVLLRPGTATAEVTAEYAHVLRGLWTGWDLDALIQDRDAGVFADPDKVRPLHHHGPHFRVAGPLNTPPSAQGAPPLISPDTAGWSELSLVDPRIRVIGHGWRRPAPGTTARERLLRRR